MRYGVGIAAAVVILAVALWSAWFPEDNTDTAADKSSSPEIESTVTESPDSPTGAVAERTIDIAVRERPPKPADAAGLFGRLSPAEIESAVVQRLAEQPGLRVASIDSVDCDMRSCDVVFSGLDANPQHVGDYSDLLRVMMDPPWNHFQGTSGSIGTREVSPGARVYVLGFTYVALVDASADTVTAARQHAACAGAWARVTEQRGSDDYMRRAHEQSAEWLEKSAGVLGLEEAQRLADELRYGPLTRDCRAMPY